MQWFINKTDGLVAARRKLVEGAILGKFTHILFLDDDMVFPANAAERLARHDLSMVGANYANRKNGRPTAIGLTGEFVTSTDKTGVQEVNRTGFGCVMIDVAMISAMASPWFVIPWLSNIGTELSEDYFFCTRWRERGHKIYIDHDLSDEISHLAEVALPCP
jgi:hypothetical protein